LGFEHPYLVLTAGVLCLPAALYLARFFFHSLAEFADDAGLSTPGESLFSAFLIWIGAYCGRSDSFFFKVLGFTLSLAALIVTVYHVLLFCSERLH